VKGQANKQGNEDYNVAF